MASENPSHQNGGEGTLHLPLAVLHVLVVHFVYKSFRIHTSGFLIATWFI